MTDPPHGSSPEADADRPRDAPEVEERLADVEKLRIQAATDADAWRAAFDRATERMDELRREKDRENEQLHAALGALDRARSELRTAEARVRATEAALHDATEELASIRRSRSWRLTAPLRSASTRLRRGAADAARNAPCPTTAAAAPREPDAGPSVADLARAVTETGLFDRIFYLARYPDVVASGADPVEHFVAHGALERRDPNELFSTEWYLAQNPDVAASGRNPVLHYVMEGARHGKDPGPAFSTARYLELNPDVAAAGLNPLAHFLSHGRAEGRSAPPSILPEPTAGPAADPMPRLVRAARASMEPPRILIVDAQVPTPDRDSGSVRMQGIIELLVELGWRVTFVSHDTERRPEAEDALARGGVEVLLGPAAARAHLVDHGASYRAAWLSRPAMSEMYTAVVRAYAVRAELLYDSVDLHWIRHQRAFDLGGDAEDRRLAEHFRKLETFAIRTADRVIAITETERRTIEERWPGTQTVLLPNVHEVHLHPAPFRERDGLVFIGNYAHPPNVDAMTWFVATVLPLVRRGLPNARLRILGAGVPDTLRALSSEAVEVVGWIRDPEPQFAAARVFVCPLRFGAGMKGKIGQAMSLGTPVVTTTIGAEGMQLVPGVHALVEDDPAAFAAAVVRLHTDEALWTSLREAGAAHVDARWSRTAARRALTDLLASAPGRPAGERA